MAVVLRPWRPPLGAEARKKVPYMPVTRFPPSADLRDREANTQKPLDSSQRMWRRGRSLGQFWGGFFGAGHRYNYENVAALRCRAVKEDTVRDERATAIHARASSRPSLAESRNQTMAGHAVCPLPRWGRGECTASGSQSHCRARLCSVWRYSVFSHPVVGDAAWGPTAPHIRQNTSATAAQAMAAGITTVTLPFAACYLFGRGGRGGDYGDVQATVHGLGGARDV